MTNNPENQPHNPELNSANEAAEGQTEARERVKTLGIRIEESLHAQLTFIAQLGGNTIADEIRRSIEDRVQAAQTDPDLIARAAEVRREIEREAEARRAAIAGFLGQTATTSHAAERAAPRRNRPAAPKEEA